MPDKAIDLIDEASAKLRIENLVTPSSIKEINTKIEKIMEEKENAVILRILKSSRIKG